MVIEAPIAERPYGPFPEARIIPFTRAAKREGAGYTGFEYVPKNTGRPFSAMLVDVQGRKPQSTAANYDKTYVVIGGAGTFTLDGQDHEVNNGDLIRIPVGHRFGYESEDMRLFEFNVLPGNSVQPHEPRIIRLSTSLEKVKREGFIGYKYLSAKDGLSYDAFYVEVTGDSPPREMLASWRNYFVVAGEGRMALNNNRSSHIMPGSFIEIPPNNIYSYRATDPLMILIEFNTPPSVSGLSHRSVT